MKMHLLPFFISFYQIEQFSFNNKQDHLYCFQCEVTAASLRNNFWFKTLVWMQTKCVLSFSSVPLSGRCASCGENVVGEGTGCTAMDQVFHVDCFVCMTCSTKLRGKPFYAMEKKAYCEPCYIVSNLFPSSLSPPSSGCSSIFLRLL